MHNISHHATSIPAVSYFINHPGSWYNPAVAGEYKKQRRLNGRRVFGLLLLAGVVYLLALMVRIYLAGKQDDLARRPYQADVIIVLGASQANGRPRPVLLGRLEHAITLYRQGYAPRLLFTGGKQPADNYTEAETGQRYAREMGVPAEAILLEPRGRTTMQSLQSCADIMRREHLTRAILVSDPPHAFRLRRMMRDIGVDAVVSPTPSTRVRSLHKQAEFIFREVGVYTLYRLFGV